MLAIPELDGRFLHNCSTDLGSVTWTLLGSTPATRWYKVRLWRINTHEIGIYSGGGSWEGKEGMLPIPGLNGRFLHNHLTVPGLKAQGCWARR